MESKQKLNISQSLIKKIWEYESGKECGIKVKEIDILKNKPSISTKPMKLGQYFEYLCTGALLRDGSIPEMPTTNAGKPTADALRAKKQSENFKSMVEHYGFDIIDSNKVITVPIDDNYNLKVVLDVLISNQDGKIAMLDIKFTGLLDDKWNDIGWDSSRFYQRDKLKIQPIMYKHVMEKAEDVPNMDFLYAIFSSKNDTDYQIWEAAIDNYDVVMRELKEEIIPNVKKYLDDMSLLEPKPEYKRCMYCPLKDECAYVAKHPEIIKTHIYDVKYESESS